MSESRLRDLAAGEDFSKSEAEALLASPELRAELAECDPSALFGALGALDVELPEMPAPRALPARPAARSARRMALGVAAASIAMACLLALTRAPAPGANPGNVPVEPVAVQAALALPPVVERVQSPTARIVALVPPSAEGATVTLILDEEIDP